MDPSIFPNQCGCDDVMQPYHHKRLITYFRKSLEVPVV